MKKKLLLPIAHPDFTCYNYLTWSNAIIKANTKEKNKILIASKYINCYYREASTKHKFVLSCYDHWYTQRGVVQYQVMELLKEAYQKTNLDLTSFLKKCLLSHSYVFGQCSWCYVEKKVEDREARLFYALVGFDDALQQFILYGIDSEERFSCFYVDYKSFAEAHFATASLKINFTLWRPLPDVEVELDIPNLILEMEDYLHSSNRHKNQPADAVYGFLAMTELTKHCLQLSKQQLPIPDSYLQKFMMHKVYMKNRMEQLVLSKGLDPIWLKDAERVADMGKQVLDLAAQYNATKDPRLGKRIAELMTDTVTAEADYLPKMLRELKEQKET